MKRGEEEWLVRDEGEFKILSIGAVLHNRTIDSDMNMMTWIPCIESQKD